MVDNWNAWQDSIAEKQAAADSAEAAEKAAIKAAERAERAEQITLLQARLKVVSELYQGTRRSQYRRERDAVGVELDALMRQQLETDEESTPLDKLHELIYQKEQAYEKSGNLFDKEVIERLKAYAATHFDENGQELPIEAADSVLTVQVSPEEVVGADGWWIFHPTGYGKVPWWISNRLKNPSAGLELSIARSNGCMQVRNQVETSNLWINDAEAVAKQYGLSARLIRMAGYAMAGRWYLLPTSNSQGGGRYKFDDFAVTPEHPFIPEEDAMWTDNWKRQHSSSGHGLIATMAGAKFTTQDLYFDDQLVDLAKKHMLFVTANYPNWVVPAMMMYYNTNAFKVQEWEVALHLAHEIDAGQKLPVLGYEKVTITGKNRTAWYREHGENSRHSEEPKFNPGREM